MPIVNMAGAASRLSLGQDIYFAADYSSGAAPSAGFDALNDPQNYLNNYATYTRQTGIGPNGEDGYRITVIDGGVDGEGNPIAEGSPAWESEFPGTDFPAGSVIYFKWKYRYLTANNGWDQKIIQFTSWPDVGSPHRMAIIMDSNGQPTQHRFQLSHGGDTLGSPSGYFTDVPGGTPVWRYVQCGWRYGLSTPQDGGIWLWHNNNNELSPTISNDPATGGNGTGVVPLTSAGHYAISWLGYHKYRGAGCQFEHTAFHISRTFDPNWYPG